MSRWLWLFATLLCACSDLGPDPRRARVMSLTLYACDYDVAYFAACRPGAPLVVPPRDGTPFRTFAWAPGAWIMEDALYYPCDLVAAGGNACFVGTRANADTIATVWAFDCPTCQWLKVLVLVEGGGRTWAQDSLVWTWPTEPEAP